MEARRFVRGMEAFDVKRASSILALLAIALCLTGCNNTATNNANVNDAAIKKGVVPQADAEVAVIELEDEQAYGRIVIELYPNVAPKMVERFKTLIRQGFYEGTTFHRIDTDLGIIQGGDPNSKDDDPENDGAGNSPLPNVADEFTDLPFKRGTVGAANTGAPASQNSQFFIQLQDQPEFDERYTIFGNVIEGIGNAAVIMNAPTEEDNPSRPIEPVKIKRVTLQPRDM